MEDKILYSAVVLDEKSKNRLAEEFKPHMPEDYEWIGHHMTIQLGGLDEKDKQYIGKKVALDVISLGVDDKVMAVGVTGFFTKNKKPHITLAVNRANGGKPMMSNNITDENWKPYQMKGILTGIVTEVKPGNANENITEDVDAKEFYGQGGTQRCLESLLNGRRDIALIVIPELFKYGRNLKKISDNLNTMGFGLMKVSKWNCILYKHSNIKNAKRLYDIMMKHGGYVRDESPEEAWEIGKLLEYTDESVLEFIKKLYKIDWQPEMVEGVADKYAEKEFGIPQDDYNGFEDKLARKTAAENKEEIIQFNAFDSVVRNPKSLNNIDPHARGVIDLNGNIYILLTGGLIHEEILSALENKGYIRYQNDWSNELPKNYITIQRVNDTKVFAIGESNLTMSSEYYRQHYPYAYEKNLPTRKEAKPIFQEFINKAQAKFPQYIFVNEKINYLNGDDHGDLNESNKKMIKEGYDIKALPFYNNIINAGGKIYQVGGSIRDMYIGKISKDLDIVITGITPKDLGDILKKYGKVDMVGASFGVIKFTPPGGEEIDIALPRTEKLKQGGVGHRDFDISADHTLPIEKDLARRDITINSIARDSEGNIIDPFGGLKDIENKIIRVTNPEAFSDDPLRMLRCIQFSSRFEFTIEPKTFQMIKDNAEKISEITKERVLIEFDKIVHKGKPSIGAKLLVESGLYQGIFGVNFTGKLEPFDYVTKLSEFMYWLTVPFTDQPDYYFKNMMKGDIDTTKEISALAFLYTNLPKDKTKPALRWLFFNVNKIAPSVMNSKFVKSLLFDVYGEFVNKQYPASYVQLAVNGNDLLELGFKGIAVGEALKEIMNAIYNDTIKNDREAILNYIQNNKQSLTEAIEQEDEEPEVIFFDFDGTLIDSPLKEPGKIAWAKYYGKPYPHSGWWGRYESLDLNVFDIKPHPEVERVYREAYNNPKKYVVLLTNRMDKLREPLEKVAKKNQFYFDAYSFKKDYKNKGQRILEIMKSQFPGINKLSFYEDDQFNIEDVNSELIDSNYDYSLHLVSGGHIQN